MAKQRKFLGISSGWSSDGIDSTIVTITARRERMKVVQVHYIHTRMDDVLVSRIMSVRAGDERSAGELADLDRDVAFAFARTAQIAIEQAGVDRDEIAAVGSSGQIIARASGKDTGGVVELGCPPLIAQQLGVPVVANFAASDLACGGCGGPLESWADWLIFRDRRLARVVIHLGGVASISFVPAAALPSDVVAFDVGACGLVLDALARRLFDKPCDRDGAAAAKGRVCPELLNELLTADHFQRPPPKVTSAQQWDSVYIERVVMMGDKHRCGPGDLIATATEMVVRSIADAIGDLTERPHEVILCGGAANNIHLSGRIREVMSPSSTYPIEHYGFDAQSYKSVCYAVLAAARIDAHPAHCSQATGASRPTVLGALWSG